VPGTLYAGTSGFSYSSWRGGFYPADTRPEEFLQRYAERLNSVELHGAFRRLPAEEQFRRWEKQVPPTFRFAVKMSWRITHGGDVSLLPTFLGRARALGDRLGPIFVKLERPRDDGFLGLLLDSLDPGFGYAVDLDHPSWEVSAADHLFDAAGVARVGRLDGAAPFRYLRLRDPPYDESALKGWADHIQGLLAEQRDVHCYFSHEDEPRGALAAERLLQLVRAREESPSSREPG
jgi:uncharacterized protein YecE (DUF72 family)